MISYKLQNVSTSKECQLTHYLLSILDFITTDKVNTIHRVQSGIDNQLTVAVTIHTLLLITLVIMHKAKHKKQTKQKSPTGDTVTLLAMTFICQEKNYLRDK